MAGVVAKYSKPCCIMHNRKDTEYNVFLDDVCADIEQSLKIAKDAGIGDDKIILDPGIGFAKNR